MKTYAVGDKVKITDFYLSNYLEWGQQVKDQEAEIIKVRALKVLHSNLHKDDKPIYHQMFGIQIEYNLYEFFIKLNGVTYIVSSLGFQ